MRTDQSKAQEPYMMYATDVGVGSSHVPSSVSAGQSTAQHGKTERITCQQRNLTSVTPQPGHQSQEPQP